MTDGTAAFLQWVLIGLVGLLIQFLIIKAAVASAMSEQGKHARTRTRLLIKKMLKEGFSKQEIIDAMNDKDEAFWTKID